VKWEDERERERERVKGSFREGRGRGRFVKSKRWRVRKAGRKREE
jgi:hypothetical protein